MAAKVQIRRGTAAQWNAANPVLSDGELGVESDTSKIKVGNGSAPWNSLPYVPAPPLTAGIVTSTELASSSIVEEKIASSAITETKIANNAVTGSKIAANTVSQAKLASTLSGITICTSSTRPGSPFTGQAIFETDTNKMRLYNGSSWIGVSTVRKVASFTASGSWTVPAGVTYAVAHIRAGGGGIGTTAAGGNGGNSSVAFASGTVTATGGLGQQAMSGGSNASEGQGTAGADNTGVGAAFTTVQYFTYAGNPNTYDASGLVKAQDGAYLIFGRDVTAGASISVTVGGGGTAGSTSPAGRGRSGGSGFVWIEYEE